MYIRVYHSFLLACMYTKCFNFIQLLELIENQFLLF